MSEKEKDKNPVAPTDYFSFHLTTLRLIGINILDIKNPFLRLLYNIYAIGFVMFSFVGFTAFEFWAVWENRRDLDRMSFILCYWMSHFMGCLKMMIFLLNKKNVTKYLKSFEEGVFIPDIKRGGVQEINIIKRAITVANTQANAFYMIAASLIVNRVIYAWRDEPLIYDMYDIATNSSSTIVERTLPWGSWFWFDTKPTPNYQIAFFYQVWCVSLFGVEIGVLDTLISAMLVHLNAQFSILHNAVITVLERAKGMELSENEKDLESLSNNNEVINNNVEILANKNNVNDEGWEEIPIHDPVLGKNFEICVKQCLEHHIKIIALSDNVEDQFNLMVLVQILGSTLIFCLQLVQLSFMPLFSTRFISMCMYLTLMLFQLAIYCYNGNEISVQSEEIATAAYNCDWFAAENRVKKYFVLMMLRAQRPIKMSAGKFAFLSLATFMSIVRGSVSYYMVLHRQNAE